MTITITRSFSRTKQVAAFEPVNASCSAQGEIEVDGVGEALNAATMLSEELDALCRSEVYKTIAEEIAKRTEPPTIQTSAPVDADTDPAVASLDRTVDGLAKTGGKYTQI